MEKKNFSVKESTFLHGRLFTSSCSRIMQCERNILLERGSFCLFYVKTYRAKDTFLFKKKSNKSGHKNWRWRSLGAVANYRHFVSNERCSFERGEGRSLFVWKKNRHFWTAACGFAWLPSRLGDEKIHNITNFAHGEAFMSKPEFVNVCCRADSQTSWSRAVVSAVSDAQNECRKACSNPAQEEAREKPFCTGRARDITLSLKYFWELDTTMCSASCRQNLHFLVSIFPYACNVCVRLGGGGGVQLKRTSFVWNKMPVIGDGPLTIFTKEATRTKARTCEVHQPWSLALTATLSHVVAQSMISHWVQRALNRGDSGDRSSETGAADRVGSLRTLPSQVIVPTGCNWAHMTWNAPQSPQKMGVVGIARIPKAWSPRFDFGEEGRSSHDFSYFPYLFYHGFFAGDCSKFCVKKWNPLYQRITQAAVCFSTCIRMLIAILNHANIQNQMHVKWGREREREILRQDPLEAILVIFSRRALIFLCLKALGKIWKMTPLLCACAVVITLETQKCWKRTPRSVEFNFFVNCDRQKRFSQNERRRADLHNVDSDFLIFA